MTASNVLKDLFCDPNGVLGLSPYLGNILADLVEESLVGSSRLRAGEIQDAIVDTYSNGLAICSESVAEFIDEVEANSSPIAEAFFLGQIALAQLVTTQNLDHKICSDLRDVLQDEKNALFIRALYSGPLSNKNLSIKVKQSEENVSRRLKKLRELGITSSRKIGTKVENFITAGVRSLIEEQDLYGFNGKIDALISSEAKTVLEVKKNSLPTSMQRFSTFGTPRLRSCA